MHVHTILFTGDLKMQEYKDEVEEILSRVKVKNQTKLSDVLMFPSLNMSGINIIFVIIVTAAALTLLTTLLIKSPTPVSAPYNIQQIPITVSNQITSRQADEIKKLVKEVSLRQNKSPLTVHSELKRMFQYYRYREIDVATYEKVVAYLKDKNS